MMSNNWPVPPKYLRCDSVPERKPDVEFKDDSIMLKIWVDEMIEEYWEDLNCPDDLHIYISKIKFSEDGFLMFPMDDDKMSYEKYKNLNSCSSEKIFKQIDEVVKNVIMEKMILEEHCVQR